MGHWRGSYDSLMILGAMIFFFVLVLAFAGLVCGISFIVLALVSVAHLAVRREPLFRRQVEMTVWAGVIGLCMTALVVGLGFGFWFWVESSWVYE